VGSRCASVRADLQTCKQACELTVMSGINVRCHFFKESFQFLTGVC